MLAGVGTPVVDLHLEIQCHMAIDSERRILTVLPKFFASWHR